MLVTHNIAAYQTSAIRQCSYDFFDIRNVTNYTGGHRTLDAEMASSVLPRVAL